MILLRLISWPYVRKHLLRSVLTTGGIVLGVALLVGMNSANNSVLGAFNQTVDRIAGKAQLQVSAGESGLPEDVLERVQAVPEVAAAAPVIEAAVDTGLKSQGKLLILAVDMTGDRSLRDYDFDSGEEDVIDDPLVFLAQPDSLIVTREFADRNGVKTGDHMSFASMDGPRQFTVRGILKAGGMAQAFGGNLGIMDIYAAQKVFGRGRKFDRIDVRLRDDVALDRGQAALEAVLGAGLRVEPPSGRGRQFESLLGIYTTAMQISSMFALFIGVFIIYNSFSIAVTQRRGEIGILRALGATRGQIRALFLGESAIAGLIGSAAGVAVGLAFTRSLTGVTGKLMEQLFGVPQNTRDIIVEPRFLLFALAMGVVTSMIAAWIPARNAAKVEPVQALQKGKYQVLGAGENRARRRAALGALLLSLLCLAAAGWWRPFVYLGYLLTVLAVVLLTPFLSLELARVLRAPLKLLRPIEGALAADSLIQAPRRTSATVAALMLSLALAIAHGGVSLGSMSSIEKWMDNTLNPDLFISSSETFAAHDFRFPYRMRAQVEQIEGIEEVQPVTTTRVQYRGKPIMIVAVENYRVARRIRRQIVAGDSDDMTRRTAEGKGVIVGENMARLNKLSLGDTIEINAPAGTIRLPIVGIVGDYTNQLGAVFVERNLYTRYFQDDTVDVFRIYVKKGVAPEQVRKRIVEQLGGSYRLFVMLNNEVREYIRQIAGQWLGLTYLQVFVAVAVAVLGIVNTLTVSIADRRRELGVVRAVGGLRAQVRGTIWLEALSIGLIGLALGVVTGAAFLYYELEAIGKDIAGTPLSYQFPFGVIGTLFPVILLAALLSAILPAAKAVRSSLVEALEYE
jgi:putative ABC transport system permease protein